MPPARPRAALLAALALGLWLCAPVARASESCRFQAWLVTTFAAALSFSERLDGADAGTAARALRHQLGEYSLTDIRMALLANGIATHEATVMRFVRAQSVLLDRYSRQGAAPTLRLSQSSAHGTLLADMRDLIGGLRCPQMSDWRAGPLLARLQAVPLRGQMLNWGIFAGMVGLVAAGTVALARIQARRRRRAWRHSCNIEGRICAGSRISPVRALDISCLGAKLHLQSPPAPGQGCYLMLRGVTIAAEVTWCNPSHCGISFRNRLAPATLAIVLGADPGRHEKGGAACGTALSDRENQPA